MDLLRDRAQMYLIQYGFVPMVAPPDFDQNAINEYQDVNIFNEFIYNSNATKRIIYSVLPSTISTVLRTSSYTTLALSYHCYETVNGIKNVSIVGNITFTWTVGSTNRYVIVCSDTPGISFNFPSGAIWAYISDGVLNIYDILNAPNTLKYVHIGLNPSFNAMNFDQASSLTGNLSIPTGSVNTGVYTNATGLYGSLSIPETIVTVGLINAKNLTGSIYIPPSVTSMVTKAFYSCNGFNGRLYLSPNCPVIPSQCFYGCTNISGDLIIPEGVTTIEAQAFSTMGKITGLSLPLSLTRMESSFYSSASMVNALEIKNKDCIFNGAIHGGAITSLTSLLLPLGYVGNGTGGKLFNFSNKFSADSLNQSISNLIDNFGTLTIGTTNKTRWTIAYPTAEATANARGVYIV